MKTMFVSSTSLTVRNFRVGLMQALKAEGFEVSFCAQDNGYAKEVENKGFTFFPLVIDRKGINLFTEIKQIIFLYKLYKKEKPNIILHYTIKPNIYGSLAAKLAGIPCINTVTGLGYAFMNKNLLYYLVEILYRVSCGFAQRTFFQNSDDLNLFLKSKLISKQKAVLVSGSGVNMDFFHPSFCRGLEKNAGQFVFLFSGRFLWDKGIDELVKAARLTKQKYSQARFWLVGIVDPGNPSGISEERLNGWQKEGVITYWKEPPDIRKFICQADCVVLPSYREGTPRSLLEALAMEKPIITTDTVGCREVIKDGVNGFCVPIKDQQALFSAFCKMIELPDEVRLEMGKVGFELARIKFDENIINPLYVKEIRNVLKCLICG